MPEYKRLIQKVEYVLRGSEKARNSDIELTLLVWWSFYQHLVVEHEGRKMVALADIRNLPHEDAISRIRRKFQENGDYEATDPVVIERRRKEGRVSAASKDIEELGRALE